MTRLAEELSDNRFGLFGQVTTERLAAPSPRWWISNAVLARAPVGTAFSAEHAASAGTSIDLSEATTRAIGEGAERYSAMNAQTPLMMIPMSSLRIEAPRCDPSEAGTAWLAPADGTGEVTVTELVTLAEGSTVLVPATMACLNFMPAAPERPITLPISTGLAFAPTLTGALWRGLCEVAERDALMRMWWCRTPLPRVTFKTSKRVPITLRLRLRELERSGRSVHLFSLTDDFPAPGCFCVIESPSYPRISCGAAVKDDLASACSKAIDEAVSLLAIAPHWQREGRRSPAAARDVTTLEDHAMFYADGEHRVAFNFLLDDAPAIEFDEVATTSWSEPTTWDDLHRLAVSFRDAHHWDVLWMDLTATEVKPYGHVVKVVVPQMIPLSPDHNAAYLGTARITQNRPIGGFNVHPHPFA
ncbi:YcaO-like family protein [Flexivirga alba]|uniref:YcaO-like family protein n=1 Tax=Flexivirga alba TaxID=702742 RepID=A0ABW2AIK4_9MICO